jgi:hypothetical protein
MKGPSTTLRAGVNINDDAGLEQEADVMGGKAVAAGGSLTQEMKVKNASSQNKNELTAQRSITCITYPKKYGKGALRHKLDNFADLRAFIDLKSPGDEVLADMDSHQEKVIEFIEFGTDFEIEDHKDNMDLAQQIKSLVESIKKYIEPIKDVGNFQKEAKEDPLAEIKLKFQFEYDALNAGYQKIVQAQKGIVGTGANDAHASQAQKMMGKALMDAADKCYEFAKTKEEQKWLKKQKKAGNNKFSFTGETHHK